MTRAELSGLISELRGDPVSVRQVLYNEARWGLLEARGRDINRRVIRYDREKALKALVTSGVIPTP